MDTGYENNALEKVTPRRYDQIWVCAVSVAASYSIQRVNLSFESPHPTAHTHTHMLHHFFFGNFGTATAWWKGWMFPNSCSFRRSVPRKVVKQDSKQIRRFQSKFTAWQLGNRGFKRVTFGKPSSPGETTKLTVLQVWVFGLDFFVYKLYLEIFSTPWQVEIEGICTHLILEQNM